MGKGLTAEALAAAFLEGSNGGGEPEQYLKSIEKNEDAKTITIVDKDGTETTFEYGSISKEIVEELPSNPSENVEYLISEPKVAKHNEVNRAETGETIKYWKVNAPTGTTADVYYDEDDATMNIDILLGGAVVHSYHIPVGLADTDWILDKFGSDLIECTQEEAQLYSAYVSGGGNRGTNLVLPVGTQYQQLPDEVYYKLKEDATIVISKDVYENRITINGATYISMNQLGIETIDRLYQFTRYDIAAFERCATKEECDFVILVKKLNWVGEHIEDGNILPYGAYCYQNNPALIGRATYKNGWVKTYKSYNNFIYDFDLMENTSPSINLMRIEIDNSARTIKPYHIQAIGKSTLDDKEIFTFDGSSGLWDAYMNGENNMLVRYYQASIGKTEMYNVVSYSKQFVDGIDNFIFVVDHITHKVKYTWLYDVEGEFVPPTAEIIG